MSELLQFSLLDMTPYDRQSWFNLVGDYNQAIGWTYPIALLLTLVLLGLLFRPPKTVGVSQSVRWVLALLGASWLWCGLVFHAQYFSDLNWAASWFGWAFVLQGVLLLLAAIFIKAASWVSLSSKRGRLAIILLLTGLVVYPLSGLLEGRTLMQLEWFPILPAPVTLVSFALLILLGSQWRHALVLIPILWAVVSAAFATTLGLLEFYFMVLGNAFWVVHIFIQP
jgi:hypothetical protein